MVLLTIRRIVFGAAGIYLLWEAFKSFRLAGWSGDTMLAGGMGLLFAIMAGTGKGG
ncbi:MAG: hypothetical protein M1453_14925 [Acidobacteria bacterium]|nr:hypothetical protein [Acidobacteriota bacterium]MCL5289274.1 hypothetical protein [Acidobacteriota bacterium]